MIKGLATRLLAVSMFSGFAVAACSASSGSDSPVDAGPVVDGWTANPTDAARGGGPIDSTLGTDAPAAPADDGSLEAAAGDAGGGDCAPGTTRCSGNGVQTCNAAGLWGAPLDCTQMACVNGGCVGSCAPGSTQCSGNGVQTCNAAGAWGNATPCTNQACVAGACAGVCIPGATQCMGTGVQTCGTDGQWGRRSRLPEQCLHRGPVLRPLHHRPEAVLGQRRAGMRPGWDLGNAGPVHLAGVLVGRVHRRMHARIDAMFGPRGPDLQRHRGVERRERVPLRVRDRDLHGRVHARFDALLRRRCPDVRPHRNMGHGAAMHERRVLRGRLHRRLHSRHDAVLGKRRAHMRCDRQRGALRARAPTRARWGRAPACAVRTGRSARAAVSRPATTPEPGARR